MKTLAPYCTSKAAVIQLTKVMALELARDKHSRQRHRARLFLDRDERGFFTSEAGKRLSRKCRSTGRADGRARRAAAAARLRCGLVHDRQHPDGGRRHAAVDGLSGMAPSAHPSTRDIATHSIRPARDAGWLAGAVGAPCRIGAPTLLPGGAVQENWGIDVEVEGGPARRRTAWVLRTDAPARLSRQPRPGGRVRACCRRPHAAGVAVAEPIARCAERA